MSAQITLDILFDRYGDLRFNYGDVITLQEQGDIFYQNIVNRLVTNFNDYKLSRNFGANLSGYIGSKVTPELEDKVKRRALTCLTTDNLLDKSEISILTLADRDKIFMRINVILGAGQSQALEKLTINTIFHASTGLLYATI